MPITFQGVKHGVLEWRELDGRTLDIKVVDDGEVMVAVGKVKETGVILILACEVEK